MHREIGRAAGARRAALGVLVAALALWAHAAISDAFAAGQCKILLDSPSRGIWVVEDGPRRIGYRAAPRPGSSFELRHEKSDLYPDGRLKIACASCPPERSPMIDLITLGAASDDAYAPEKHPPSYRHELLNEEAKAANVVTISEPIEIAIGAFKGWSAVVELVRKAPATDRSVFAYGYVSDGCLGGFFMLAFDIDATGRWMPMGQMIDQLKAAVASFALETFDPSADPEVAAELKKLPR